MPRIESRTPGSDRNDPALDWDLIQSAQETLANRSLEDRALTAMEAEAAGSPDWQLSSQMLAVQQKAFKTDFGTVTVPFLYTKAGYEAIYVKFSNDILSRIQDEQWVLGEAGKQAAVEVQAPALKRAVAKTYSDAYIDKWNQVLRGVEPLALKGVNDAVELTRKPQPITTFLIAVVKETALVPADQQQGAEGTAGVIITQRFGERGATCRDGSLKGFRGATQQDFGGRK